MSPPPSIVCSLLAASSFFSSPNCTSLIFSADVVYFFGENKSGQGGCIGELVRHPDHKAEPYGQEIVNGNDYHENHKDERGKKVTENGGRGRQGNE